MLISPVRHIGPDSFQRSESVQRSSPPRKTQETQDVSRSLISESIKIQNKDVITLTPNFDGDLETTRKAVSAVFERVREQITNTLGIRGVDDKDAAQLLPPENATGKEILEFFNPENTAKRIVGFAASFITPFLEARSAKANEENVAEFTNLITNAIKDGFSQAKGILGNPDKESEVGSNIERTFELVLQGIKEFQESFADRSNSEVTEPSDTTNAEDVLIDSNNVDVEPVFQPIDTSEITGADEEKEPINLEPVTNPFALKDEVKTDPAIQNGLSRDITA